MKVRNILQATVLLMWCIGGNLNAQPPLNPLSGPFGGRVTWLAAQQNALFAAMWPGGVYRTTDEGLNWTHMNLPDYSYGNTITIFADSQNIFAGMWAGLYQSSNGGNTWQKHPLKYVTAVAALSNGYVAVRYGDTVSVSDANGQNWTDVYVFTPSDYAASHTGILVDADTIYLGSKGRGIYKSYDRGQTWVACNTGIVPGSTYSFYRVNNRIYVSSNTGIYYTDNWGGNWTMMPLTGLDGCLDVQSIYSYHDTLLTNVGITPVMYNPNLLEWQQSDRRGILTTCYQELNGRLFCGAHDGVYVMQQDFNHWEERINGMGATIPYKVFVNGPNIIANPFISICQSPDSGKNWTTLAPESEMVHFSGVCAYVGDTIVAIGASTNYARLYYTTDTFKTYTYISDTNNMGFSATYFVKSKGRFLSFQKDTLGTPGYYSTLFYTDNWGGTWQQTTGLPTAWATEHFIEVGPYLMVLFTEPQEAGMYISSDTGATWTHVSNYRPVSQTYQGAYLDSTIYTTADEGVFLSKDGGISWDSIPPTSHLDVIYGIAAVNDEVYGMSFHDLYLLDRTARVWNKVATLPDHSLTSGAIVQQGNRLLMPTYGGPIFYYDIPAVPTGVPVVLKPLNMQLYPNPSSVGMVQLRTDTEMPGSNLRVYNVAGNMVYASTVTGSVTTIPVSGFAAGTYVAKITDGVREVAKQFVVK